MPWLLGIEREDAVGLAHLSRNTHLNGYLKKTRAIRTNQKEVEETAVKLLEKNSRKAKAYLTKYLKKACASVVKSYWDLGDFLWSEYDEKW